MNINDDYGYPGFSTVPAIAKRLIFPRESLIVDKMGVLTGNELQFSESRSLRSLQWHILSTNEADWRSMEWSGRNLKIRNPVCMIWMCNLNVNATKRKKTEKKTRTIVNEVASSAVTSCGHAGLPPFLHSAEQLGVSL